MARLSCCNKIRNRFPLQQLFWADAGYQGPQFQKALAKILPHLQARHRQTLRSRQRICGAAQALDRDRLYNVAKLGFEWSSFIERRGRRRRPLLISASPDQHTSQFVTGDSESSQDLMRHRRLAPGPTADGGAHGPAHGSPSAASARIVRSDKVRPTASDRGLRPSRSDGKALAPTAETQRCAASQSKDGDRGGIRR